MIQSYPDQLLKGKLVPWYDKCLRGPNSPEYDTQRGFQSCLGNFSSDVRTRALELYQLGLLKGPLIQPRDEGSGIPEGWQLVQRGEDVLSPLGHLSYKIGRAYDGSKRLDSIINLLCVIYVTSLVKKSKDKYFFTFELQEYIEKNLRKFIRKEANLKRYAAISLVSCLHSDLDWLTAKYQKQVGLEEFLFAQKNQSPVIVEGNRVEIFLKDSGYNINSFVAPKKPLFWAAEKRGLYTRACNNNSNYLDIICDLNNRRIAGGDHSIANDLVNFLNDDFDLLNANIQLVKNFPELGGSWQIVIDSLFEFQNLKKISYFASTDKYSVTSDNLRHASDITLEEQLAQSKLVKKSLKALKKAALKNQNKVPKKVLAKVSVFIRDPSVVLYVKKQANGICDLCEKPAPFNYLSGEPYLECHHLIRLADGGIDSISNAVALCANCHRKMHALKNDKDVSFLQEKIRIRDKDS